MIYEVWNPDAGEVKEIEASAPRWAAEAYREQDGDDFEAPEEVHLAARRKGDTGWEFFSVTRDYSPSFHASRLAAAPDGFELPEEGN